MPVHPPSSLPVSKARTVGSEARVSWASATFQPDAGSGRARRTHVGIWRGMIQQGPDIELEVGIDLRGQIVKLRIVRCGKIAPTEKGWNAAAKDGEPSEPVTVPGVVHPRLTRGNSRIDPSMGG